MPHCSFSLRPQGFLPQRAENHLSLLREKLGESLSKYGGEKLNTADILPAASSSSASASASNPTATKLIGLYFASSKTVSAAVADKLTALKAEGRGIDIVLVSLDADEAAFKETHKLLNPAAAKAAEIAASSAAATASAAAASASAPATPAAPFTGIAAVPFATGSKFAASLRAQFCADTSSSSTESSPALVLFDAVTGRLFTARGVDALASPSFRTDFPFAQAWYAPPVASDPAADRLVRLLYSGLDQVGPL